MRLDLSIVVIGRNEGERLVDCLHAIKAARTGTLSCEVIYVDSNSSDESISNAARAGARVIGICPDRPCAAAGRNAGWRLARGRFILFLDGDTELAPDFIPAALHELDANPRHAVVWGHRRERHPGRSLYNRVLDLDWIYPAGDSEFCGGDALFRREALEATGGFDEALIAGEEPELCARLRSRGLLIRHIDVAMTSHDLSMYSWRQYWRRAERAGHAYAEIPHRLRCGNDGLWRREARRNRIHATVLLIAAGVFVTSIAAGAWLSAWVLAALAAIMCLRTAWRARWRNADPFTLLLYALHSHLQQIPILWGQLVWLRDHHQGKPSRLIEYKGDA